MVVTEYNVCPKKGRLFPTVGQRFKPIIFVRGYHTLSIYSKVKSTRTQYRRTP